MEIVLRVLCFLVGGAVSAGVAMVGVFFVMFWGLRVVSILARDERLMYLMYYGMVVLPLVGIGAFLGGGVWAVSLMGR